MTLSVENVSYTYLAGTPLARPALCQVSFALEPGECVAIVGVSGSGKSTLARIVAGLTPPDSGSVTLDGEPIAARTLGASMPRKLLRWGWALLRLPLSLARSAVPKKTNEAEPSPLPQLRRPVLLAFQNPEDQFFSKTVMDELLAGLAPPRDPVADDRAKKKPDAPDVIARRAAIAQARESAREALRTVELPPERYATRNPFTLSGGEQRRLALAVLLARRPRVLVLDEPSAGLDAPGRATLYGCIARIRRAHDTAVLIVSHDLEEVAAVAERTLVLRDGALAAGGPTNVVLADAEALIDAGLVPPPLVRVRTALAERGHALPGGWLSMDEAEAALAPVLPGAGGRGGA
jgi:energy-coupling factor transport system ATP-binding protein